MTNGKKIIIGIVLIIISYFFGFTAKGTEILRNNFNISLSNIIGLGFLFIGLGIIGLVILYRGLVDKH